MIPLHKAALAVPGSITTLTGGFIYDRHLLEGLRDAGRDVELIELSGGFPDPTPEECEAAFERLAKVPKDRIVILDGLALGSLPTQGFARIGAAIVAMIHHPLAHEGGLEPTTKDRLFRTERDNLRLARHVLVPSPHTRAILIKEYGVPPKAITVARPGTNRPVDLRRDPASPPLILSVGNLLPRKGHDILVTALAQIADLDWQAAIVGTPLDPSCAADLGRRIDESGLSSRIQMPGRLMAEELQAHYRRASIFALATRYEGYGIVFDEALLHGLPIVSTLTGAVPDTVPGDAGILVPCDDAKALASALRQLLTDHASYARMSEAAALAGAALPGWDETARIAGTALDGIALPA
ncbi:glycosyltransferase family 4 protein [Paracoccus sp. MBLB3053]|uniref:Glycosyltransferase family 4 protein n=1 Tax=Paracoccus aurantius TaxID=3073814 RepID=A0ABU2HMC2_9RHOB|nr:glycosyltransferase family 4 protein [Paracoccus sp. MBLB3053]MDS9466188.1 glycosyltransferase family 4 protein [Paracoccus sp. MBLB3053]